MKKTFLLLLLPFALTAQNNISVFDHYMQAETHVYGFNGNVLVAKNGHVIYKNSFGYADFDTRKKLDSNSIFDCGSIAKEFTAMGILILKDMGKISYSDTLRKFFPGLPYNNITIQELLTHTSGMPDGFDLVEKYADQNKIADNQDMIRLLEMKKPELLFKPGENLMYSGTAFCLLASIIAQISGQSYPEFMKEEVFKPLGMEHTQVANFPRQPRNIPGLTTGYTYSDSLKKYRRADGVDSILTNCLTGICGEGMIITTTGDLLKWDRALLNHRLLSETTQAEMLTQHAEKIFPKVSFGYGIRVGENGFGKYIFHNGYYPGYISMLINYRDEDVTVIVLSNNESRSEFIADGLAAITLNKEIVMPSAHKEIVRSPIVPVYGGKYMMQMTRPPYMAGFPIEFVSRNDSLFIQSKFSREIQLMPESANQFFFADGSDQQIAFETGADGQVSRVWHIAWGLKKELKKIDQP